MAFENLTFSPYSFGGIRREPTPEEIEVQKIATANQNPLAIFDVLRGLAVTSKKLVTGEGGISNLRPAELNKKALEMYMQALAGQTPSEGLAKDFAMDPLVWSGVAPLLKGGSKGAVSLVKDPKASYKAVQRGLKVIPKYYREAMAEVPKTKEAVVDAFTKFLGSSKKLSAKAMQGLAEMPANMLDDLYKGAGIGTTVKTTSKAATPIGAVGDDLGKYIERVPFKHVDAEVLRKVSTTSDVAIGKRPFSELANKYKFSGEHGKLYGQVRGKIDDLVKTNESLFKEADFTTRVFRKEELIDTKAFSKAMKNLGDESRYGKSLKTGAKADDAAQILTNWQDSIPDNLTLDEARNYLGALADNSREFGLEGGKNLFDSAAKHIAKGTKDNYVRAIEKTYGPAVAKQLRGRNKELQVLIEAIDPILKKTKSEIKRGALTEVDNMLLGLAGGRILSGGPALPIVGAITAKLGSRIISGSPQVGRAISAFAKTGLPEIATLRTATTLGADREKQYADPIEREIEIRMREKGILKGNESMDDAIERMILARTQR